MCVVDLNLYFTLINFVLKDFALKELFVFNQFSFP